MNFSDQSRVWIYLSNRAFTNDEVNEINQALKSFCVEWTAHGANLKASGEVRFSRFIILMVDESAAGASGCSIDKSVHFIQAIEKKFGVELFNRLLFAWKENETVNVNHASELQRLFDERKISEDTLVFNPVIKTKKELDERWMIPLKESWIIQKISKTTV